MWTVVSQTRKAIPGLSKVLLLLVLLATLLFAYMVQRHKHRLYAIHLDRPVSFTTRAGEFNLKVPSNWKGLSEGGMSAGLVGQWAFDLPNRRTAGQFMMEILSVQPRQEDDFARIILRYLPTYPTSRPSIRAEKDPEPIATMEAWNVILEYTGQRETGALIMKLVLLPNGNSLALVILGPQLEMTPLSVWLEQIARTLEHKPRPGSIMDENAGPRIQAAIKGVGEWLLMYTTL